MAWKTALTLPYTNGYRVEIEQALHLAQKTENKLDMEGGAARKDHVGSFGSFHTSDLLVQLNASEVA